jgi:hypothetical protein
VSRFAENTTVAPEKSRAEIETVLRRYGADGFAYASYGEQAMIQFTAKGRTVRFLLKLPSSNDKAFTTVVRNKRTYTRTPEQRVAAWEQACRQSWRALALVVKAKLEAVASGITVFEAEFLAHIVLPDGRLVGQVVIPEIASAYEGREPPQLLLGMGAAS